MIDAYNKEILRRDLAGEVSSSMKKNSYSQPTEIIDGLYILEIEVPSNFIGKKIKDIDVRNKYGVDIILIKKKASTNKLQTKIPNANYKFQAEDNLLILGDRKKIEFLSNR